MAKYHKPKVSIRLPSYNHEKYIHACLTSVLNQTFQDFEIIITDDCSTDRTVDIINEFKDSRINLEVFSRNQGCSAAGANCIRRSHGKYIANLCSDDAWEKDKLEKQITFIEAHPNIPAVFTKVQFIDENGNNIIPTTSPYFNIFEVDNRSKEEWLNHFFYRGNCLCLPSVLIRKNVYEELNYQDKRLAGLNDFDLWVRFCLKYELHILDERLTLFRLRENEANASGNRIENHIRNKFELKQILDNYLKIDDVEQLAKIFPECNNYGAPSKEYIPYFLGRIAYATNADVHQLWGLETLFKLMKNDVNAKALDVNYSFSYPTFHKLCSTADVFKLKQPPDAGKQVENI